MCERQYFTAEEIAPQLGVHPQSLRMQARLDPSKLGFPITVIGKAVRIPKQGFINWIKGQSFERKEEQL